MKVEIDVEVFLFGNDEQIRGFDCLNGSIPYESKHNLESLSTFTKAISRLLQFYVWDTRLGMTIERPAIEFEDDHIQEFEMPSESFIKQWYEAQKSA